MLSSPGFVASPSPSPPHGYEEPSEAESEVPSLPPTSPVLAPTAPAAPSKAVAGRNAGDFSNLFHYSSSPEVPTRSSAPNANANALPKSSMMTTTISGSKKRRSSEFDEDGSEEYSSPTLHGLMNAAANGGGNGAGRGMLGAPQFDAALTSSPAPPSSPTLNLAQMQTQQQHKRIKSRGVERAATLGSGLISSGPFTRDESPSMGMGSGMMGGASRKTLPKRPALSMTGVVPLMGHRTASSTAALPPSRTTSSNAGGMLGGAQVPPANRRAFSAVVPKQNMLFGASPDSDDILDEEPVRGTNDDDAFDGDEGESEFDLSMDSFGGYGHNTGPVSALEFGKTTAPANPTRNSLNAIGKGYPSTFLSYNADSMSSSKRRSQPHQSRAHQAQENSPAQRAALARRENIARLGGKGSRMLPGSPLRNSTAGNPNSGLGGFGDSEADGKILPCHKVREDGLMRIRPDTVSFFLFLFSRWVRSWVLKWTLVLATGPRPHQRTLRPRHCIVHDRRLPLRLRA